MKLFTILVQYEDGSLKSVMETGWGHMLVDTAYSYTNTTIEDAFNSMFREIEEDGTTNSYYTRDLCRRMSGDRGDGTFTYHVAFVNADFIDYEVNTEKFVTVTVVVEHEIVKYVNIKNIPVV